MIGEEFFEFLKESKIITMIIGVLLGTAVKPLITSILEDVIYPLLNYFKITNDKFLRFKIGNITINLKRVFNKTVNLLVLSVLVWFLYDIRDVVKDDKTFLGLF